MANSSSAMNSALALAAAAAAAGLQNFPLGSDPSGKAAVDGYSQLLQVSLSSPNDEINFLIVG